MSSREDAVNSACALATVSVILANKVIRKAFLPRFERSDRGCRLFRFGIFRSLCAVSPLHCRKATFAGLNYLQVKSQTMILLLEDYKCTVGASSCRRFVGVMIDASLPFGLSLAYIRGDWIRLRNVLYACEQPLTRRYDHIVADDLIVERYNEHTEGRMVIQKSVTGANALDSVSLESLRHLSSDHTILGRYRRLRHRRRQCLAPLLALVEKKEFHPPSCLIRCQVVL
jgi:hypothetical protein